MVVCSFTETYDLSTKTGRMTLIGIHTPSRGIFQRLYPGFLMQYSKVRILSQDVAVACASMLPADPLQVGVASGEIAPEDLFNPILYKAASNDSWSTLEARINGFTTNDEDGLSAKGFSADVSKEHTTSLGDEFGVYYSLLSDRRGWRIANPQAGLTMTSLTPLVFEKWYSHGVNSTSADFPDSGTGIYYNDTTEALSTVGVPARTMRGSAHAMPAFNTTVITGIDGAGSSAYCENGEKQHYPNDSNFTKGYPVNFQADMPYIPKVMTGCIIVPPSRLHQLYYRMTITTHVEFSEPRSMVDVTSFGQMHSAVAPAVYFKDYTFTSKLLTNEESTVDVSEDATVTKIMESQK